MRQNHSSKLVGIVMLLALCMAPAAQALDDEPGKAREGFGLGLLLGEPLGITAKFFIDPTHAIQVHAAYDFTDSAFDIILDYTYHVDAFDIDATNLEVPLYFGAGLKLGQEVGLPTSRVLFGFRFIIGFAIEFTELPIEIFAEIAPVLRLTPKLAPDVDGGAGIRYYF